ncbi:MAG: cell division protein FtsA [Muribaculaceae bacterium]|jgi:cell division protein FtsA
MSERYIAAVEISSSKIIAAVGKTSGAGQLDVIAVEQENCVDGVRYGIIQNLEETALMTARIINRLEQRPGVAPRKIKSVFVGRSGRSLRNIPTEVSINLPDDTEITDDIINRLRSDALRTAIDNSLEVVDAVPRIYKIGKSETHSPKGAVGNCIHATYDLVVCRPELKRNIKRTLTDKLHIETEAFVVTALATGHLILTPDEKRLGCMLVDMGAETTTVTIYRKGSLCYFATIPLGGRNITRDITSLNVLEVKAEEMKLTSGNAIARESTSSLNINGVKLSDISNLVVARAEEIVANVVEQMEYAGLKESDLPGGIICIGGGSRLQGITDLLSQQADLPVRRGQLPAYVRIDDINAVNSEISQVVSVLYAGATLSNRECLEIPARQEIPEIGTKPAPEVAVEDVEPAEKKPGRTGRLFNSITERITRLFGNPDDNSELIE